MQAMGTIRLGRRAVMYTVETIPKGKNRVLGTIQIMTGFIHISFGIILSTLTSVYTSFFVSGEIPFLGGASYIVSGCLSIGAEKSPTECAVKGSQAMNIISAIFALLGILTFIVDLSINGPFYSEDNHHYSLVMAILIEPNTIRTDAEIPSIESSANYPPNSNDVSYDLKVETV
uniref:membrane-spanning 4-domains subfamily A member 12-like isoform X2 n=1 Tax=Euleptes europaea TaxID=460621 RepID=UPI0025405B42|nr:membrane-spanning 4-domains subfamily A member 12-like isoform X2 [Euleptes europaea]